MLKAHRSSTHTINLPDLAYEILDLDLNALPSPKSTEELGQVLTKTEDIHTYYKQYIPFIVEETIAVLKTALDKIDRQTKYQVHLRPGQDKLFYYRHDQATLLTLLGADRIDCAKEIGAPRFILSAIHDRNGSLRLSIIDIDFSSTRITVKGDFEDELTNSVFEITPLASLVNLDRMFSACNSEMPSMIIQKICRAQIDTWPEVDLDSLPYFDDPGFRRLNAKQKQVVLGFNALTHGVLLLQGPPGTGKTTVIVELVKTLMAQGERTLICAPSNKATQVLADRAMKAMPDIPMLLVAVASKTSGDLKSIAFDQWIDRYPRKLSGLLTKLDILALIKGDNEACLFTRSGEFKSGVFWGKNKELKDSINLIRTLVAGSQRYAYLEPNNKHALIAQINQELTNYQTLFEQLASLQQTNDRSFPSLNESFTKMSIAPEKSKSPEQLIDMIDQHQKGLRTSYFDVSLGINTFIDKLPKNPIQLLASSPLLFCTLSISGRVFLKRHYENLPPFSTIIMDEAGQAVEAEALIPFGIAPAANKMLLVGDPRQLPATTIARSSQDTHYEWSMLWRLMEANKQPALSLVEQYRMRQNINHFPSQRYYEGRLSCHSSIFTRQLALPTIVSKEGYNVWIDSHGSEETCHTSFMNRLEASYIVQLVDEIKKYGPNCSIGVICFYSGQVNLVKRSLDKYDDGVNKANISVSSVDGFQGDEKDIIIISTVRANSARNIGFTSDFRRLNVAITRARDALIICGSVSTFSSAPPNEVQELITLYRQMQQIVSISQVLKRLSGKSTGEKILTKTMPIIKSIGDVSVALSRSRKRPQRLTRREREQVPLTKLYGTDKLFSFAQSHAGKLEYEKALEYCRLALELNSNRADIYHFMSECATNMEDVDQASVYTMIANSIQSEIADPSKKADYTPPQKTVILSKPEGFSIPKPRVNMKAKLRDARTLSDDGYYDDAVKAYNDIMIVDPTNPEVMIGLGWVYNKMRKNALAEAEFERSLTVEKTPLAYYGLIIALKRLHRHDEATDKIYECVDIFPYFRSVRKLQLDHERSKKASLSHSANSNEEQQSASPDLKGASIVSSGMWRKQPQLSKPLRYGYQSHSGRVRVTQDEIEKARNLSQTKRDPESALREFKRLYERDPRNSQILSGMAWCQHHLRRNEEAISLFEKSLEIQNTVESFLGLARSFWHNYQRKEAHETIDSCKEFVSTLSRPPRVYSKVLEFKESIFKPRNQVNQSANGHTYFKQRSKSRSNAQGDQSVNAPTFSRKRSPGMK